MANEENELLLKVLCTMLSYGVKIKYHYKRENNVIDEVRELCFSDVETLKYTNEYPQDDWCEISWKPYLRPMSSMTAEEKQESRWYQKDATSDDFILYMNRYVEWLDSKHFDWRTDGNGKTMIEKGLALEAPEGMYNI